MLHDGTQSRKQRFLSAILTLALFSPYPLRIGSVPLAYRFLIEKPLTQRANSTDSTCFYTQ